MRMSLGTQRCDFLIGVKGTVPRLRTLFSMSSSCRRLVCACVVALVAMPAPALTASVTPTAGAPALSAEFARDVTPRLQPSTRAVSLYAQRLDAALAAAGVRIEQTRFLVLVDRNPAVQSLLLFLGAEGAWQLVGAAPVSTGRPGRFDHFETPGGVFDHVVDNPDFRAEGTPNQLGIRGYGRKGARIYDFGWVVASKGWGDRKTMAMRLQMHATDPDRLEQRLGTAQSKGCIRIPASLNAFIDRFAILDEDYEERIAEGRHFWVLPADRSPTPWSGRYLVVVDSRRSGPVLPVAPTNLSSAATPACGVVAPGRLRRPAAR
jgi:hypothetical protein